MHTLWLNVFHFIFVLGQLIVCPRGGTSRCLLGTVPQMASQTVVLSLHPITALVLGSSNYVVCPWSTLLSVFGSLSFQGHISHIEAAAFKAPKLLQRQRNNKQPDASQVRHVVSVCSAWACPLGKAWS